MRRSGKPYGEPFLSDQRFEAPYELVPVDLIGNYHCDKLGDTGQKQVGMECPVILSPSASHTEAVLEVVD